MSALADVKDIDCVATFVPLTFDSSGREVSGALAVLRRVLYRWCTRRGTNKWAPDVGLEVPLLELEAATLAPDDVVFYQGSLEREAEDEDFVVSATAVLALDSSGRATISAGITLVDGNTYSLAVAVSGADAALLTLGVAA